MDSTVTYLLDVLRYESLPKIYGMQPRNCVVVTL